MEEILSISFAIVVGVFFVGLSHKFLYPFFENSSDGQNCPLTRDVKWILRSAAGLFTTGMLVLIVTSSVETAALTTAIGPFLWSVLLVSRSRHRKKRRALITRELPLLLDYLVLQVESGHSIQQALRSASGLFLSGGPLHTGLCELDESIQVGCPIGKALGKFGQWLDTSEAEAPILAISQAIQHGTPLGMVLRAQSKRMREYLILDGEQFANTVSVKILIPLLFFIFPASFLVIFSPVIVSLSGRLP